MQIEDNRLSSHENEEAITWYRSTGRTVRSASFDAVPDWLHRTDRHYPTTGLYPFLNDPKPYSVLIDELGENRIDWGVD